MRAWGNPSDRSSQTRKRRVLYPRYKTPYALRLYELCGGRNDLSHGVSRDTDVGSRLLIPERATAR